MPELGASDRLLPLQPWAQDQSWLGLAGKGRILVPVYCHMDQFLAYMSGVGMGSSCCFVTITKVKSPHAD